MPKLTVRIIEAKNLRAEDYNGSSDPYVEVRLKNEVQEFKTKVVKNNLHPHWDETFTLDIPEHNASSAVLYFKVYDFDVGTVNDYLGELELPVELFKGRGNVDEWKPILEKKDNQLKPGQGLLHYSVHYHE
eukprot:TRINITY_DN13009_c0_g1_i1.p1 TRINITY_DN13009_c0_g1~~TRINITY_DN13009_c0_g1_i1.p1  ORF type:complete len:131 (+),score=57.72 TRINITY_DN13009_c0_g1_i1:194-586(+)